MCLLAQRDRCLSAWTIVSIAGAKPSPSASTDRRACLSREPGSCALTPSARDQGGPFAGDREATREEAAAGSEELRRIGREVAKIRADGRQHASYAPDDLRARAPAGLAQAASHRDYAGRHSSALRYHR